MDDGREGKIMKSKQWWGIKNDRGKKEVDKRGRDNKNFRVKEKAEIKIMAKGTENKIRIKGCERV